MPLYGYTFLMEVEDFNIEDYVAHLGWVASSWAHFKIYTRPESMFFYLHDEVKNRLFQFAAADPGKLRSKEAFDDVVKAFLLTNF